MTLHANVRRPGTNLPAGVVRVEYELSPAPRYYWSSADAPASWHEADSLQEATARALGFRDLEDAMFGRLPE